MFHLDRDLIFFDVETTGLNVVRDRILQIAMIKFFKNGSREQELSMIIHPGMPIPEEAYKIHKIGDKEVAGKPYFHEVAKELLEFIGDSDLAGYNSNRFDVPILAEEFARCDLDLQIGARRLIDVQRIFYKMEPRTLKAAYQFYCNEELVDAHDALVDIRATVKVLNGQLIKYRDTPYLGENGETMSSPVKNDMQALHDFTNDSKTPDVTQKLKYSENGIIVFNFGKYSGLSFEQVWLKEPNYLYWILDKEFSYQVKNLIKEFLKSKSDKSK
jgi:DNA polymerase III subunit epsilon